MHFTIYKITNIINGKYYIGKHQTKDLNDGYMGSGRLISAAIKKYGIENFKKEILHVFDNEKDMNDKEKELVVISENTYNLCEGGQGGFSFINRTRDHSAHNKKLADKRNYSLTDKSYVTEEFRQQKRILALQMWEKGAYNFIPSTKGLKYTEEQKNRLSQSHLGSKNSQYGSMWITNGKENKKIKKENTIPDGWYRGRIL